MQTRILPRGKVHAGSLACRRVARETQSAWQRQGGWGNSVTAESHTRRDGRRSIDSWAVKWFQRITEKQSYQSTEEQKNPSDCVRAMTELYDELTAKAVCV